MGSGSRTGLDPGTRDWVRSHAPGVVVSADTVQSLWSGYGRILRIRLRDAAVESLIVKQVEPPDDVEHPRGWAGDAGRARKLRSYEVERCFYTDWCPDGGGSHRTAKCHSAERTTKGWRFLLEDLDAAGFDGRARSLNREQLDRCLEWLASFHARFLGREPTGLWPVGTYWHLATRSEELAAMEDPELQGAAPVLDSILNGCRFQTLVHGDAKVANFCFGAEGVAAVDFQYVGGGCGIKDVAYFLGSCLDESECESEAEEHLETYFGFLGRELRARATGAGLGGMRERSTVGGLEVDPDPNPDPDPDPDPNPDPNPDPDPKLHPESVIGEWRSLYPAAWADFHRFLVGWAPGHWKIHEYTRRMTREALARL